MFFIIWSLFTLIIRVPELGFSNSAIAFAYWARLTTHLLLLPALLILFQDAKIATVARRGLLLATIILVLLGFLQLWLIPDFTTLTKLGWDPHQGRLTSTWLDPNFFGAFLAIILPFVVINATGGAVERLPARGTLSTKCDCGRRAGMAPRRQDPSLFLALVALIIIALILTQSRSAFVALALSTLFLSPFITARALRRATPDKLIVVISTSLLLLIVIAVSTIFLHDRLLGLATLDATAQLRLGALQEAWHLAEQHTLLGVGAGAYQFAAAASGLIPNFTIHSRAGADNSLLTLWVTTGIVGVVLFLLPWAVAILHLAKGWFVLGRPQAAAALFSLTVLLIHSQFINSFLYSHLLITLIIIITLALSASRPQPSNV